MTTDEKQVMQAACDAIRDIYYAFGAPGHHGYETPEGKALYALYRAEASLVRLLAAEYQKDTSHDEH